MNLIRYFSLCLLCSTLAPVMAATDTVAESEIEIIDENTPISLTETLENAYMRNAELDAARASLRVTDENVAQALSGWRPSSSIAITQTQSWNRNANGKRPNAQGHDTNGAVSASQNIFAGGSTYANTESAKNAVYAGRFALKNKEQETLLGAVSAHLGVTTAREILAFRKASEDFLKKTWEQTQARFEVGELTRTEVAAAEGSYLGAVAERISAEGNLQTAFATYSKTVGMPAKNLAKAKADVDLPESLKEVTEHAEANNPAMGQALHNREAAEYEVNAQIGTLLPSVDVEASIGRNRQGGKNKNINPDPSYQTNASFTTTVSVPIYDRGSNRSKIRQAHQTVAQRKVELVAARRDTIESATKAWEDLVSARDSVKSLKAQVKAQELAVEGVNEESKVGTKTVLDVLEQEQRLIEAQVKLVQAEQSEAVASYQVMAAIGHLTARDLELDVTYYDPEEYYDDNAGALIKFWKGKDYRYVNEDSDES